VVQRTDFGGEQMQIADSCTGGDLLKQNTTDFEKHIIVSALKRTGGNQSEAARQLGTTIRILTYRIHKYNIDINEFRTCRKS
jgi:transcriptional regulator with GAF, ATPase, and Fis domain